LRRNILVVEDNKDLRIFIMKSITSLGDYTPIGASNGKDAIEKLSEYKVDLVITDIRMPEMDGIEFIAYLNNKYPHIPVIVLTAYPEYEEEISKYQTMKYLLKPVDKEKLKKAIEDAFESHKYVKEYNLLNLINLIKIEKKTCTFKVFSPDGKIGILFFKEGDLMDAKTRFKEGEDAFYDILMWKNPEVEIEFKCSLKEKKVKKSLNEMISLVFSQKDAKRNKVLFLNSSLTQISMEIPSYLIIGFMNEIGDIFIYKTRYKIENLDFLRDKFLDYLNSCLNLVLLFSDFSSLGENIFNMGENVLYLVNFDEDIYFFGVFPKDNFSKDSLHEIIDKLKTRGIEI